MEQKNPSNIKDQIMLLKAETVEMEKVKKKKKRAIIKPTLKIH